MLTSHMSWSVIVSRCWEKVRDCLLGSRVEFLLKTDSGYPMDVEVNFIHNGKHWVPFALIPFGQLHQSPPLPVLGNLRRCPSHQCGTLGRKAKVACCCLGKEVAWEEQIRLIKDGHLPSERGKETWDFQRICTGFIAPRGQRLGERQKRTAWWARHSEDTANDYLVQTCLY